ncbi:MAG: hypothetical protein N3D75_03680 [Candidatus Aenigmarchaeota archaeon]|nr:hypothetical protein [Candidatus Aenigmarchaeota archaeon]
MKGISTVIASLLLVTITISLAAVGYNFFRNVVDVKTSGNIEIHDVLPNKIIVSNNGDKPLSSQDLKVLVNGQQYPATVEGGQIEPFKSGVINIDLTSLPEGDYRMTVIGKGTSTSIVFYHYPDYTITTTTTTRTPTTTRTTTSTPSLTTSTPTGPTTTRTATRTTIVTPTTILDSECDSYCKSINYDFGMCTDQGGCSLGYSQTQCSIFQDCCCIRCSSFTDRFTCNGVVGYCYWYDNRCLPVQ